MISSVVQVSSLCLMTLICQPALSRGIDVDNIEWIRKPQNAAIVQGQELIIDCQVNVSKADIIYRWMLDGKPVGAKTSVFFNHSLLIPQLDTDDLGVYTCLVSLSAVNGLNTVKVTANATVIEAYIEPFLISPRSQVLSHGRQLILTCVTGPSAPALQIYWTKNGEKTNEGEQRVASFGDYDILGLRHQTSMYFEVTASLGTAGEYRCVAFNELLGKHMYSEVADITFESTPSDLLPEIDWTVPEQLVISEGQELVLSCNSQVSTEPVRTDWFIGRYLVDESKRVYVLPNTSLAFLPLHSRDKGTYRCRLTNSKGSTWSPEVRLVIAYLETQFEEEPQDMLAVYGDDVRLPCKPPSSLPKASVLWYKDFQILDLAGRTSSTSILNGSLLLASVTASDQGQYYCIAVNEITQPSTRTSRVAKLTVEGPPEIVEPPVSTKLLRGTLLHLTCRAVSNPVPKVTWSFQGRPLFVTDRISIMDKGQQLWISNIGQEWNGRFTCLCANEYGSISATATVTVIVPPSSLHPIGELRVKSGRSLTIQCPIVGVPQPSFQWFHNDSELQRTHESNTDADGGILYLRVNSDLLVLHQVTPHHSGVYSCRGSNEGGEATSAGSVVVQVPPYLTATSKDSAVILGQSLNLTCKAEGNPKPSVQWKVNNSIAAIPGVMTTNNTSLTIYPFNWSHVGSYTCEATNIVGVQTHTSSVKILIPPSISKITHPQSAVQKGHRILLSCHYGGIPRPAISWSHNNVTILPSLDGRVRFPSKGVLEIEAAQMSDSGQYECQASSVAGVDKELIAIAVYGPPNAPSLLKALPLSSSSVHLIWKWSGIGQAAQLITGFRIFYRERTSEEAKVYPEVLLPNATSLEVFGLKPVTPYLFYVVAVNNAGNSPDSNVLAALTLQAEPSSPKNLRVETVTAEMAMLTWEMPLSPNGQVKRYQLKHKGGEDSERDYTLVNISSVMTPTQEYTMESLRPYSDYTVEVRAATVHLGIEMWGNFSAALTFRTDMSEPSLPPQTITANVLDASSVTISWEKIPELARKGPISGYGIRCMDSNSIVVRSTKTNSSTTHLTLHGLHPWRQYRIIVYGENPKGKGPDSKPVAFTTLPTAPVATPRNLTGQAVSANSVLLSWEPLRWHWVTCEISSYEIQLRIQGSPQWSQLSVPSVNLTHVVKDLVADWTFYEFRIAAFTESVTPGLGPFTEPIVVRTKEGYSSPVTALFYSSEATRIILTWRPPLQVKGNLLGYSITYALKDSVQQEQFLALNLPKAATSAHLKKLVPNSLYNVSISAINGGGKGRSSILLVRTEPQPSTTSAPETTSIIVKHVSTEDISFPERQQQSNPNHSKKNVAGIVAGSLVGGVCLVLITIFFCLKCKQYRRNKRLSHVIDTEEGTREVRANSYSRTTSDPHTSHQYSYTPQEYNITDSSTSQNGNHINTNPQGMAGIQNSPTVQITVTPPIDSSENYARGRKTYDNLRRDSALDIEDDQNYSVPKSDSLTRGAKKEGKEGSNSKRDSTHTSQLDSIKRKLSSLPRLSSLANRYSKFDDKDSLTTNMENADSSFSDPTKRESSESWENDLMKDPDSISVMSTDTLKRRTRMRSESAAAIAVLRSSQGQAIEDTEDASVDRDVHAEVVFNERTVL